MPSSVKLDDIIVFDAKSRRLIKDGISLHRKKGMNKKQAEEAFVESLAEYSAKQIKNKGTFSRMRSWVKNALTHLSHKLGLASQHDINQYKADIVRMIGEKVYKE